MAGALEQARVARLATVGVDGAVRLVPICFAVVDGWVVSAVDHKPKRTGQLRRLDDMEAVGSATVLVDRYEDDWSRLWWIRIRGRTMVHRDRDDEAVAALAALAAKYPQYREHPPGRPRLPNCDGRASILAPAARVLTVVASREHEGVARVRHVARRVDLPVWMVIYRFRASAVRHGAGDGTARPRVCTRRGRWLVCRASCLQRHDGRIGDTALVMEPARPGAIAPIAVEAYDLSEGEQQIIHLIARGVDSAEIADELPLSHPRRGTHVRSIFAKAGVSSRGELVAKLYAEFCNRRTRPM